MMEQMKPDAITRIKSSLVVEAVAEAEKFEVTDEEIDEEMLTTVNKFFENNLNVSETSRQLFIHRNTLIYRIEKLQKATGLDMRVFDDALTLKIALMVVNYMKYQSIPRKATSFMNEDSSC